MPARKTETPEEPQVNETSIIDTMQTKEFRDQHLITKLATVMGEVGYIPKTGWNDFFKYHYVEEAALTRTIRPLLAAAGIMIIPNVLSEEWLQDVVPERNGRASLCKVFVEYTVTDGVNEHKFCIPGYGVDKSDKSIYKAMTGSMKYALMKLFEVETGDDPERETAQPADSGPVEITGSHEEVEKGGHSKKTTRYQLQRISATMREKGLDRADLVAIITTGFGVELQLPEEGPEAQKVILEFLADLSSEDAGALIADVENYSKAPEEPTA